MKNRAFVRTCVSCGKKADKSTLLRFSAKTLELDNRAIMQGRGYYTCNNESCIKRARTSKLVKKYLEK